MTERAAIKGEYVELRLVKTRNVYVASIETPAESIDQTVAALGMPKPGESIWVAIARLDVAKVEKPKERTASQRAWALCQSTRFGEWLFKRTATNAPIEVPYIATTLRDLLMVESRGELDTNPEARARFETLEREYQESTR